MRILGFILLAAVAGSLQAGEYVINRTESNVGSANAAVEYAGSMGDPCNPCSECGGHGGRHHGWCGHRHGCGHHGCGHHGRNRNVDGLSPYANCGCNGSYKYPVPPLYTYHWRGQFSAQLMTDYHSPWRFPPLRPYIDEEIPAPPAGAIPGEPAPLNGLGAGPFQPASYVLPTRQALPESGFTEMSQAMDRMYR